MYFIQDQVTTRTLIYLYLLHIKNNDNKNSISFRKNYQL